MEFIYVLIDTKFHSNLFRLGNFTSVHKNWLTKCIELVRYPSELDIHSAGKEVHFFCGTQEYSTVFTKAVHWNLAFSHYDTLHNFRLTSPRSCVFLHNEIPDRNWIFTNVSQRCQTTHVPNKYIRWFKYFVIYHRNGTKKCDRSFWTSLVCLQRQ